MIRSRRVTLPLDGTWQFVPDAERRFGAMGLPPGEPISVPGCWEAQVTPSYGILHAWYARRFTTPADWKGGTLLLRFGSAMARAVVWLDGREIGANQDGYLPFEVEGGPARPGADHELVVEVENPVNALSDYPAFDPEAVKRASKALGGPLIETLPHGKQTWYTSTSGLTGSVAAEIVPESRFASVVVLPDLQEQQALVRWRLAGSQTDASAMVRLSVTSPSGEVVAAEEDRARACEARISIPSPEEWDLGHSALYRLDAVLDDQAAMPSGLEHLSSDEVTVRFGMRSIGVQAGSVLLNGRSTYLRGALDQDFWPDGRSNPPSPDAYRSQAALAREMGLNLLRCHVKVPDPAYLDAADEAGLLVWCELPFWDRWSHDTDETARRMLERMVETMGNHPSIIAWTIINEDWGTDLRHSARDRSWLRATAEWLKELDPTRLVVDNSACEAPGSPNFHVRTDIADFHAYRSMPDGLSAWRSLMTDLAQRPAWLWSPFEDARPTGDEALVLSEFGGWGLPAPSAVGATGDREPWWWTTGDDARRAAGIRERFEHDRLDRIWPDPDALAVDTQWRQFEGLAAQVREIRRHPEIRGYVITELSDAFWEPNGLLDVGRVRKAFHGRLAELNGPAVLVVDLPRSDLWAGQPVECDVVLSSFPDQPSKRLSGRGGRLDWRVKAAGHHLATQGSQVFQDWPDSGASVVSRLNFEIPIVEEITSAELVVEARSGSRGACAVYRKTVLIVPRSRRRTTNARSVAVRDPRAAWSIRSRLEQLGHRVVEGRGDAEMTVASCIELSSLEEVDRGGALLLLARSTDALPRGFSLPRPVTIRSRRSSDGGDGDQPWLGDWTSVFAWALPRWMPGLAAGGLLGDPHAEIFPHHVMAGLDAGNPDDGIEVGLFAGWLHRPVALLASLAVGRGHLVATTLRLSPEAGPVATAMLESLVQRTAEMTES